MSGSIVKVLLVLAIFGIMGLPAVEAGSYNGNTAASYAYNNAYNDVTGSSYFRAHGGDCTNFVSNALQAGGWTEVNNGRTSDYSWYYDYTPYGYSYTWGAANNFYKFLTNSYRAYPVSVLYKKDQLEKGDIVQADFGSDGVWDHTMIVTDKRYGEIYLSYHTKDTRDKAFLAVKNDMENQARSMGTNVRFLGWHLKSIY